MIWILLILRLSKSRATLVFVSSDMTVSGVCVMICDVSTAFCGFVRFPV